MTDKSKPADLYSGRFGKFSISGFLVRGYGSCGKPRWGWILVLKESDSHPSDQDHRYLVYETDFQEVLEGDLRKGPPGAPSIVFDKKIAAVPQAVRKAALEAIAVWESRLQPVYGRCLSRCTSAKRMGTDYCAVLRKRKV